MTASGQAGLSRRPREGTGRQATRQAIGQNLCAELLVENPQDAIRIWINQHALTVDESGAHSFRSRRDGHISRHPAHDKLTPNDLAGRDGA